MDTSGGKKAGNRLIMPSIIPIKRVFHLNDQKIFAELSGDWNPLHVDPNQARRSLVGGPVVHGINALLWALDCWIASNPLGIILQSLDVEFLKPIPVGVEVSFLLKDSSENMVSIVICNGSNTVVSADFVWGKNNSESELNITDGLPERREPWDISAKQIQDLKGQVPLSLNSSYVKRLFPNLFNRLPRSQVAAIIATTRMVGCECPGLHSLFSELHLVRDSSGSSPQFVYEVERFDHRFNLVSIKVSAPEMSGTVKAFLRPPPQKQPSCLEIKKKVVFNEFRGQKALVVGGSRGLGEVVAKILATGGAEVMLTYNNGIPEAQRVVADIVSLGGAAECLKLDVTTPDKMEQRKLQLKNWSPTHLYFMATPFISTGAKGDFMPDLFTLYCLYYIKGFSCIFDYCNSPSLRGVFYPSTVFIDEVPTEMGEYISAKSAGEALCGFLQKINPGMRILYPRLPRLTTDQTLSLIPVVKQESFPVMLELVRKFQE
jgi:hypothetical protein